MDIKSLIDLNSFEEAVLNKEVNLIFFYEDDFVKAELWYNGLKRSIESVDLFFNSKRLIKDFMSLDVVLTEVIQDDFEKTFESGGWIDWIEKWLKDRYDDVMILDSGNTYNYDNDIWRGDVFEFVHFVADVEGAVIMWHLGGDVRGNYSYPEVWVGDFEGFFNLQALPYESQLEYVLNLIGYDGSINDFETDLEDLAVEIEFGYGMLDDERMEELRKLKNLKNLNSLNMPKLL